MVNLSADREEAPLPAPPGASDGDSRDHVFIVPLRLQGRDGSEGRKARGTEETTERVPVPGLLEEGLQGAEDAVLLQARKRKRTFSCFLPRERKET